MNMKSVANVLGTKMGKNVVPSEHRERLGQLQTTDGHGHPVGIERGGNHVSQ